MFARATLVALSLALVGVPPTSVAAEPEERTSAGNPTIRLDRLVLPPDLVDAKALEKHLRLTLKREARHANWGAGRTSTIEYRFTVTRLEVVREGDLIRVHCGALGQLPGGQKARSELSFGGAPAARDRLVRELLDMVARGVVTRLAELERRRRGLS